MTAFSVKANQDSTDLASTDASHSFECPICGGQQCEVVYSQVEDAITHDLFSLQRCSNCDLCVTEPRVTGDRYYPNQYRAYGKLVRAMLGLFYALRVRRWAAWRGRPGSLLEIGCGPGFMLHAFQKRGWRVLGIERSQQVAQIGRQSYGVEITTTEIYDLDANLRFDLIVVFHVLEHIADPVTLLRECAQRLTGNGRLIIAVPNFASWQARFAGPRWLHLDVPRHLNHFTPATLNRALGKAGLHLREIRFASPEHDPYGWVESTVSRISGRMNIITRFLMGLDRPTPAVIISLAAGAILAIPAFLLAAVSWPLKKGAIMEVIAQSGLSREQ